MYWLGEEQLRAPAILAKAENGRMIVNRFGAEHVVRISPKMLSAD
jgi:hypothetical protein